MSTVWSKQLAVSTQVVFVYPMKFLTQTERMSWLKKTAKKIYEMEHDRKVSILSGEYGKAFSLLKGIKFARAEFAKESRKYEKRKVKS